jgi:trk system potassium uptake protein TrkA
MRIIIIGAGEVGYHIAKTLCRDNDVFIIEKDEEVCSRARQLDVQVIHGNGADVKLLKKANIVACMASKILNDKVKTIARFRDQPDPLHS